MSLPEIGSGSLNSAFDLSFSTENLVSLEPEMCHKTVASKSCQDVKVPLTNRIRYTSVNSIDVAHPSANADVVSINAPRDCASADVVSINAP